MQRPCFALAACAGRAASPRRPPWLATDRRSLSIAARSASGPVLPLGPQTMMNNEAFIRRELLSGIGFLETAHYEIASTVSMVDSGFHTDRSSPSEAMAAMSEQLGSLPEGFKWLAIVFRDQPLDISMPQTALHWPL